jgi:hypothetical protein
VPHQQQVDGIKRKAHAVIRATRNVTTWLSSSVFPVRHMKVDAATLSPGSHIRNGSLASEGRRPKEIGRAPQVPVEADAHLNWNPL